MTSRFDRVVERSNDILTMRKILSLFEVLSKGLSSYSHDISVDELVLVKVFENSY